ncbi:ankyrin repeat domain-containing protein [Gulosibacter faecalis]|jgi:ankyrin repeat protein|uniref:Ankyrin repeat domain-containing protein n=1 Tax=Gulosibacter faecalis TaxID=272240 RepID=A0ABW5V0Q4_9MICO|nr:ankyrin repeat domain-containing protein [Gulosibacter faecalis]
MAEPRPDNSPGDSERSAYEAAGGLPAGVSAEAIELANQLFDYARENEAEMLAAYLDAGAPVNMQDAQGNTMLILAAYHFATETVAMLIEHGADLDVANDRGQNALTCAVFKQDIASCRELLEAGADPDAGQPSPRATAKMFSWPAFDELLAEISS